MQAMKSPDSPLLCPWKDCEGFKPIEYTDQTSAELDLINHIANFHSCNQTRRRLVSLLAEKQKTIPIEKIDAAIKDLKSNVIRKNSQ